MNIEQKQILLRETECLVEQYKKINAKMKDDFLLLSTCWKGDNATTFMKMAERLSEDAAGTQTRLDELHEALNGLTVE
ncbi:MAG: hypothetical protein LUH57_00020 [Ruminococcus sp.]|nr:hypothetical protein [Ruminococcus sp.]